MKTVRLRRLEAKLSLMNKSEDYVKKELEKIRKKGAILRNKISKEKKAISLVNKAKKLR